MTAQYPEVSDSIIPHPGETARPARSVGSRFNYLSTWGTTALKQESPERTILVVDDAALVRRSTSRILQRWFTIDIAHSAEEAVEKLSGSTYYGVISDYQMTGKDGIWLLSTVQQLQPWALRILVSTATPSELENAISTGLLHSFVRKPLAKEQLLSALLESEIFASTS